MQDGITTLEKFGIFLQRQVSLPHNPEIWLQLSTQENEHVCPHKDHMNPQSSIFCNSPKVEPFKFPSTSEWISKCGSFIQWNKTQQWKGM